MDSKKNQTIGFRVAESLKKTLGRIAAKETRSISQQVEHFVKLGIINYLENNPEFDTEKKANNNREAKQSQ